MIGCSSFKKSTTEFKLVGVLDINFLKNSFVADVCLLGNDKKNKLLYLSSDFIINSVSSEDIDLAYVVEPVGKINRIKLKSESAKKICINYELKKNNINKDDYKGANSLARGFFRGTEQSAWYPFFFDKNLNVDQTSFYKKGRLAFDIEIRSSEKSFFYINGTLPKRAISAELKVDSAVSPLIYVSRTAHDIDGLVVGEKTDSVFETYLEMLINSIRSSFNGWSNKIDAIEVPSILIFKSTDKAKDWSFVSYPSIAITDYAVSQISKNIKRQNSSSKWGERFISHEIAHYYFGERIRPSGKEFWFLLESFAEYFALRYLREKNPIQYKVIVDSYLKEIKENLSSVTKVRVSSRENYDQFNRYKVGPILLLRLEELLGRKKSNEFVSQLIETRTNNWSYDNFKNLLLSIDNSQKILSFEKDCLEHKPGLECLATPILP